MTTTKAVYRFKRWLVNEHGAPSVFDTPVIVEVTAGSEAEAMAKAKALSNPETPYLRSWDFTLTDIVERPSSKAVAF